MTRPGWCMYGNDHPIFEGEGTTHAFWAAIWGIRLSEGQEHALEFFQTGRGYDEAFEPRIAGGQLLLAPSSFKVRAVEPEYDSWSSPRFTQVNPLLRSYYIARSYSRGALGMMGL